MKRHVLRAAILIAVLAGIIAIGYAYRPKPVPVATAAVERGPLALKIVEYGVTALREPFVVVAPVAGQLQRITLEPGDPVKAAETVIAVIAPPQASPLDARAQATGEAQVKVAAAALQRAMSAVRGAELTVTQARTEARRMRQLAAKDAATPQESETASYREKTASAELAAVRAAAAAARHELQAAEATLYQRGPADGSRLSIRAPIDGQVMRVLQRDETVVAPGTPLAEIGDPRDLEVVVDVLSRDALKIQEGHKALISGFGSEAALPGSVRRVEPTGFTKVSALGVEEQRVKIHLALDDAGAFDAHGLAPGYAVETTITTEEAPSAVLKVPLSAVFREGSTWKAFVAQGNVAKARAISLERRGQNEAEVVAGLAEGDEVIVYPSERVRDGARIERQEEKISH